MKGSCLCGSIEFEINVDTLNAYQCHCSLCKKQSGSSSNSATLVERSNFRFNKGSHLIKSWVKASGFRSDFCTNCGSPVPNPVQALDMMWIPLGLLPMEVQPQSVIHLCTSTLSSWHLLAAHSQQFESLPDVNELKKRLQTK
jgi:hypothetical protein